MVRSTYYVALNSLLGSVEAQEKPWNKTGGMTTWMASTASAGALKSGESETTPPIIAWLRTLLARHLNDSYYKYVYKAHIEHCH